MAEEQTPLKLHRTRTLTATLPELGNVQVTVRAMTYGESRAYQQAVMAAADVEQLLRDTLVERVIAWQLVDDDGYPVPPPSKDPASVDLLLWSEINALVTFMRTGRTDADRKN